MFNFDREIDCMSDGINTIIIHSLIKLTTFEFVRITPEFKIHV